MMLFFAVIAVLMTICCPPTLPLWLFVLVGFHTTVRRQTRLAYLSRNGALPALGTADWFRLYL